MSGVEKEDWKIHSIEMGKRRVKEEEKSRIDREREGKPLHSSLIDILKKNQKGKRKAKKKKPLPNTTTNKQKS